MGEPRGLTCTALSFLEFPFQVFTVPVQVLWEKPQPVFFAKNGMQGRGGRAQHPLLDSVTRAEVAPGLEAGTAPEQQESWQGGILIGDREAGRPSLCLLLAWPPSLTSAASPPSFRTPMASTSPQPPPLHRFCSL